jgi:hypothetical protein
LLFFILHINIPDIFWNSTFQAGKSQLCTFGKKACQYLLLNFREITDG